MANVSQQYQGAKSTANGGPAADVKDDLAALREDIASLASSVSSLATEKFGGVASDVQAVATERFGDFESAVRRNPTQSAMIAVGVGFLVGLVLTR
jgi:ElaB/YqjD/DUF883 family membrane-anchored ribosome-binding protein